MLAAKGGPQMRKVAIIVLTAILAPWAGLLAQATGGEAAAPLELVARLEVPQETVGSITDVRWAGSDSIYLAVHDRISEVRLTPGLPEIRRLAQLTPETRMRRIRHLAVSPQWIVVSSLGRIAWRSVGGTEWNVKSGEPGFIHEIDVRGDELIILGSPDATNYDRAPGGIVWRADLSGGLTRWNVVYQDSRVADDFEVIRVEHALGSIRYLSDEEVLVAPTFIPGALLLSPSGKLRRGWRAEELERGSRHQGESRVREWWTGGALAPAEWHRFLAAHQTIEEVLALPEGPGVVVREPSANGVRYRLGVLGPKVRWYDIPVGDLSSAAQLRGDVDAHGRIVLAGVMRSAAEVARVSVSEVLVLRLPH
jgi:hypothetical protein